MTGLWVGSATVVGLAEVVPHAEPDAGFASSTGRSCNPMSRPESSRVLGALAVPDAAVVDAGVAVVPQPASSSAPTNVAAGFALTVRILAPDAYVREMARPSSWTSLPVALVTTRVTVAPETAAKRGSSNTFW